MILAFDTSGAYCAAALFARDALRHSTLEPMAKGQAERIMGLCQEVMNYCKADMTDLTAIGVGVGPGNFTGIRISVSAARGMSLALGIPAIPVSTFEMVRDPWGVEAEAAELVSVAAPRGAAYVQSFRYGRPKAAPEVIDVEHPPEHLRQINLTVTGFEADKLARALGGTARSFEVTDPAGRIANVAAWKHDNGHDQGVRPAPMYVRAPDVAPARDLPPKILP